MTLFTYLRDRPLFQIDETACRDAFRQEASKDRMYRQELKLQGGKLVPLSYMDKMQFDSDPKFRAKIVFERNIAISVAMMSSISEACKLIVKMNDGQRSDATEWRFIPTAELEIKTETIDIGILFRSTDLIGRRLIVDSNNCLREMTIVERLKCKVNPEFKDKTTQRVKEVIKSVIAQSTNQQVEKMLPRLRQLSAKVFDRKKMRNDTIEHFSIKQFGKNYAQLTTAEKAKLCFETLGIRPSKGKGFSDSYIMEGLHGEKLGIFKPGFGEPMSLSHPHPLILLKTIVLVAVNKVFNVLGSVPTMVMGQGYIAEKVAKDVADAMGQGSLVSNTHIIDMNIGKKRATGSFQEFDKGPVEDLSKFLEIDKAFWKSPNLEKFEKIPVEEWIGLGFLHYITGNVDAHGENMLVYRDQKGRHHLLAIDGGMSFGEELFDTKNETQKFLLWLHYLPVQDLKLTAKHLQMLDTILESIEQNSQYYKKQESFRKRYEAVKTRIEVLKRCILKGETLGKLLELKTKSQIDAYLSEKLPKKKVEKKVNDELLQTLQTIRKQQQPKTMEDVKSAWQEQFKTRVESLKTKYALMVVGSGQSYQSWQNELTELQLQKKAFEQIYNYYDSYEELLESLDNGLLKKELLVALYSNRPFVKPEPLEMGFVHLSEPTLEESLDVSEGIDVEKSRNNYTRLE